MVIFSLMFFFCGCKEKKEAPKEIIRPVNAEAARQKDIPIYVESFGVLDAPKDVDIKSQVTGKIMEAHFKEGQEVKKGDLLFTIDKSIYQANLDKALAALKKDEADLKLKTFVVKRDEEIAKTHAIAEQDYAKYLTEMYYAQAQVELDKADIEYQKVNLEYCDIKSPIDGITGKRLVDPGNIVVANTSNTLVNVKTIDHFYVDFTIPERYLDMLRKSMTETKLQVIVIVDQIGQSKEASEHVASLHMIENAVATATGTIALRAVVDNKKRALWAGQFVRIRLILRTQQNALVVPAQSVQSGVDGEYIFIVTGDNKAEYRLVGTGERSDGDVIITGGEVKTGDMIVTAGQMGLRDKCAVRIVQPQDSKNFSAPAGTSGKNDTP